jgi:glycosyltransferase involved in cell wall biosynthesis
MALLSDVSDAPVRSDETASVAVVMVVRDQAPLTLRALVALAGAEAAQAFETVVVNDGSSDATATLLGAVEGNFAGLHEVQPRGFAAGVDRAVAHSGAEQIVIVREDLVATRGWLESLSAVLAKAGVGAARPRVLDGAGRDVAQPLWPCLAIRREVLEAVGGMAGVAEPSRAIKLSLLDAVEGAGYAVVDVPEAVLLALPDGAGIS